MGWKQRIAVVVLLVFAALPVSATLCAAACDPMATADVAHHASTPNCSGAAHAATGALIQNASADDCSSHDGGVRQVVTTAAGRLDLRLAPVLLAGPVLLTTSIALTARGDTFAVSGPPGTPPLTSTPLVLRV